MRHVLVFVLVALSACALHAQAAPNERICFQGRLTDPAGAAITVATNVQFRLYTQPTGGTALWTETQTIVPSAAGVFTANLGAVQSFGGIDFSQVLYVGLTFGSDSEMTPRYLLTSAVTAQFARNAANLGGLPASAYAQLSGAAFTGAVSAPTFTGNLAGNAASATTAANATNAADSALLGGNNAAFYLNRANHTGSMPSSALTGNLPALNGSALTSLNAAALTGTLPSLNGSALTSLTGANVTGTVANATNAATATNATQLNGQAATFYTNRANHTGLMPSSALTGALPALDGAALTNLSGASVTGTVGNAGQLLGATWASPQAIGATTPGAATFTTLGARGLATLGTDAATPTAGLLAFHDATASNTFTGTLQSASALTASRTWTLPDNTGTLALLSDIPSAFGFVATDGSSVMTGSLNLGGFSIINGQGAGFSASVSAPTFIGALQGNAQSATTAATATDAQALNGNNGLFYLNRANHSGLLPSAALTGNYAAEVHFSNALNSFAGDGSGLTGVNAAQLNGFNSSFLRDRANHFGSTPSVTLSGPLPALDGSALTGLNASNLGSGTVPSARLGGTYSSALAFSNITSANATTFNVNGTQTTTGVQQFADGSSDRFRVPRQASDPFSGVSNGMIYYNTTSNKLRVFRNGAWADLGPTSGTIVYSENPSDTAVLNAGYVRFSGGDIVSGSSMTTAGAPSARANHTAVWTGSRMLVWGGHNGILPTNTGGSYDPAADSWTAMTTTGAPAARFQHTAIWTGARMLVWGGHDGSSPTNTGGAYDPATDSWTTITTAGAPSARRWHTAVWTGSAMLVWGGSDATVTNTGGSYDPATDSWAATTTVGAPGARNVHTAVWTGAKMLVWGGDDGSALNTGGSYDPATDSWTAITTTGAPAPRSSHTAVWTGATMHVWGGAGGSILNSGGSYDPVAAAWSTIATNGAPSPVAGHTAVWTGLRMLVWGGAASGPMNSGGKYVGFPVDGWSSVSTTNAPGARSAHTAVWTGSRMLVWGGSAGVTLNTGGSYEPLDDKWAGKALYAYRAP